MSSRYLASYVSSAAASVAGTLAASESGDDVASIAGRVPVTGSVSAVESGADTASITGAVASGGITGVIAAQESGSDTASIAGTVETPTTGAGWDVLLSNGLTSGETLVQVWTMLRDLHAIHGLRAGAPLTVTASQRQAGGITQSIADNGVGLVTVTRQ